MAKTAYMVLWFSVLVGLALADEAISSDNEVEKNLPKIQEEPIPDNPRLSQKLQQHLFKPENNEIEHGPPNLDQNKGKFSRKKNKYNRYKNGRKWSSAKWGRSNYIKTNDNNKKEQNMFHSHNDDQRLQDIAYDPQLRWKKDPLSQISQDQKLRKVKKNKKNSTIQKPKDTKNRSEKRKKLKKSLKKEIKKALKQGMSRKEIYQKFAKENKFPKKLYKKFLLKKKSKKFYKQQQRQQQLP